MSNTTLSTVRQSPQAQRAKAFDTVGSNTFVAATVSKLREGNSVHHRADSGSLLRSAGAQSDMLQISSEQKIRVIDNENALQIMPELEWASRVIISSILSPKDMTKRELNYSIDVPWIPATVRSAITEEVKNQMEQVYGYSNSLYAIFKDALFMKGAHPRLIMPEAAVDRIINSGEVLTLENLSSFYSDSEGSNFKGSKLKGRGYFGELPDADSPRTTVTMESHRRAMGIGNNKPAEQPFVFKSYKDQAAFEKDEAEGMLQVVIPNITLTDNYDAIKLPIYRETLAAANRAKLTDRPEVDVGEGFGEIKPPVDGKVVETTEAFNEKDPRSKHSGLNKKEFRNATYKGAPNNIVTHLRVPGRGELARRSVGRPLVASCPSEAVIPLHSPGDVRRKLGFILLYDENGHMVSMAGSEQILQRAQTEFNAINASTNGMNSQNNMGSMIISKAARNLSGGTKVTQFRQLSQIFEQLVEDNLIPRLMNGAYPGGVELADASDVYTLMLARTLCSMHTRMVFVPAEMMTYFAFDYHDNGMGKSLLDANKTLIAMRAGLLFTRVTGEMRNSIPLTKVTMKIDEDDPDWEKTWEMAYQAISTTRQPQFPLSTLAVNDIMEWIHRAGFFMTFQGHPRMPDTSFEFEKTHHQNVLPDPEFYDSLGKQLYLGLGVPPEIMNMMDQAELATAITSRSIMFTQTILEFQKIASGLMTDDHHRLIMSDGTMLNKIVGLVREHWGAISSKLPEEDKVLFEKNPKRFSIQLVERIVTAIVVSLPSPDTTTLANQREGFDQHVEFLKEAMQYFVGEGVVSADLAPEIAQKMSSIAPMATAALVRDYMSKNNILPELFQISSVDEEGRPAFDLLKMTEEHTSGLIANIMSTAKALAPMEEAAVTDSKTLGLGSDGSSDTFSSSGGGGGTDFSGGFGGFDDLGGGGDLDTQIPDDASLENTDTPSEDETPPSGDNTPPAE